MIEDTMSNEDIIQLLNGVKDPEIPVLSVVDLGILRKVEIRPDGSVHIVITPTYNGCPAMGTIEQDIREALSEAGINPEIETRISPAWTTDWITKEGRKNLEEYGIAPPAETTTDSSFLTGHPKKVRCPQCKSTQTEIISQFGSTACKALYRCKDCLEPFEYFKCI